MSTEKTLLDKRRPYSTSRFESILSKIQNLLTDYCEFRNTCPYFDPDNYTCANDGGSHCGKYRKLKAEKIKERKLGKFCQNLLVACFCAVKDLQC